MSTLALSRPAVWSRPNWVKVSFVAVLALAAALCLWNLTISGYSNEYYAAAARAGSESWKAWFFGAIDPGSFITVDKPPLSLWLMGLSARVFGFSSFSILLPQALCTIAAVALLFATVRRVAGDAAGLIAALALALTPITIAIGRVNNPDALLVLLLVASAWFTVRALESGRGKHLALAGAVVGLAFMTKMLQGWMVVPALGAAYLWTGKPALLVRVRQLAVAFAVMVAVSAAWPLAVTLWPGSKPYIGGSTDGSPWNLIFGYNGFGRIFGEGGGMGGGGGPTFGGSAGLLRMFNTEVGAQIAWLLPLAGVALVFGLWTTRRAARTDLRHAGLVLFGVWALVHVLVFSTQQGIFHPYYVSALAPAVAALAGIGLVALWGAARESWAGVALLAATTAGTAWLAVDLLSRTTDFAPWLRVAIPVAAAIAVLGTVALRRGAPRAALVAVTVSGAFALFAGPASYAVANLGHGLNGNNVLAGPASMSRGGFGGGPGGGGGGFRGGTPPSGAQGGFGGGAPPSGAQSGTPPTGGSAQAGGPPAGGGFGGRASVSSDMLAYLEKNQGGAKYLLAASGSQTTAPIIIKTGKAVVTIGGFSGQDNSPTVAQLQQMIAKGELKYVLASGNGAIDAWVQAHGTAVSGYTGLYKV
ncbi:glycosyltransferase family 39 protein [Solirubrobacter ginsenosidimutans]|uniref:Glycosyltransferase family 39 protein n=1 Tax=Solirubrobacter ginsenosidimutans TaxID=490573 RepID=A0A9X3N111_9ACTN|nr:glycosyltransferase family 39 protein [Solirubrobacter ginsenosidimutans]MDA0166671.1 glycosyltransferase family 39 protein [Solirubrobacter ginsenosidimutans]